MQRRIHQFPHGVDHVVAGERGAVGETHARTQLEIDAAAVFGDLPFGGQLAFQLLGVAIQPDQHAAGQIANRFGRLFFH